MASSLSSKQPEPAVLPSSSSSSSSSSSLEANVPKLVMQKNPSNPNSSPNLSCHHILHQQHEETSIHPIVYCRTTSNKVVHYSPCRDRSGIISSTISDLKKEEIPPSSFLRPGHGSTNHNRTTALSWLSSLLSRRRRKRNGADTTRDTDIAAMIPHGGDDNDDGPSWEPPRASSWEQLSSWEKPSIPSPCAEEEQCCSSTHEPDHGSNSNGEAYGGSKHEGKKQWPVLRKFLMFQILRGTDKEKRMKKQKNKTKGADEDTAGLSAAAAITTTTGGTSPAPLPPSAAIARSERNHIGSNNNNSYYSPAYYNSVYSTRPNTPRAGVSSRPNTPRGVADHGLLRFYLAPNSFPVRPRSKSRHRRTASLT